MGWYDIIRCTQEHDGDDPFLYQGVPYIDEALCVLVNWRLIGGHWWVLGG